MTKPCTLPAMMLAVCCALIPGLLQSIYTYGWIIVLQLTWCVLCCLAFESIGAKLNQTSIVSALSNWTWLVSALLIAKSLPIFAPAPYFTLACAIAILAVKYGAGGLGKNQLNPTMAGLAVVAICFYQQVHPAGDITPNLSQDFEFKTALSYFLSSEAFRPIDAMSYATPLAEHAANSAASYDYTWLGFGLGGVLLYWLRIIRIEIPLAIFCTYLIVELVTGAILSEALVRITYGGLVFAAFFIATDPVTSPITVTGRIVYGALIGAVIALARANGVYPDGIVFAILSANLATPHIDRLYWRFFNRS